MLCCCSSATFGPDHQLSMFVSYLRQIAIGPSLQPAQGSPLVCLKRPSSPQETNASKEWPELLAVFLQLLFLQVSSQRKAKKKNPLRKPSGNSGDVPLSRVWRFRDQKESPAVHVSIRNSNGNPAENSPEHPFEKMGACSCGNFGAV